jgi:hypothetical protein
VNRRAFLKRFGIGLGSALALAHLPAAAVEGLSVEAAGKRIACEILRTIFNAYVAKAGHPPASIAVGRTLFEMYESELVAAERFVAADAPAGWDALLFKGVPLYSSPTLGQMNVVLYGPESVSLTSWRGHEST